MGDIPCWPLGAGNLEDRGVCQLNNGNWRIRIDDWAPTSKKLHSAFLPFSLKTSQELLMLSSVTLDCRTDCHEFRQSDVRIVISVSKVTSLSRIVGVVCSKEDPNRFQKSSKFFPYFSVRSCLLITLIKCLKTHRSLGLLFVCQMKKYPQPLSE